MTSGRYSKDGPCLNQNKVNSNDGAQIVEMSPLGNFLDDVSLLTDVEGSKEDDEEDNERRLVANLMTIHASKVNSPMPVYLCSDEMCPRLPYHVYLTIFHIFCTRVWSLMSCFLWVVRRLVF